MSIASTELPDSVPPPEVSDRRRGRLVAIVVVLLLGAALGAAILPAILARDARFAAGDVVALRERPDEPFGQVLRYEPAHVFAGGRSGAAYEIRLHAEVTRIWFAKELVDGGMIRVARRNNERSQHK